MRSIVSPPSSMPVTAALWAALAVVLAGALPAEAQTTRVNVASDGTQANSYSFEPALSASGQIVVFTSNASNLDSNDTNSRFDVFLHHRANGRTVRVSVTQNTRGERTQFFADSGGGSVSADGLLVAFVRGGAGSRGQSGPDEIFLYRALDGYATKLTRAHDGSDANGNSNEPSISADGKFVAFSSRASNLVPVDTNQRRDVFVLEISTGQIERVSVASGGSQGNGESVQPSISGEGRFVAFASDATNLDASDTNGARDIFVHDRRTQLTRRVSEADGGIQATSFSNDPAISADGLFVAFTSAATNLVRGDTNRATDVFVRGLQTSRTTRVSVGDGGIESMRGGSDPSISDDGRFVAFASADANLVPGDTNGLIDVFVHDRGTGQTPPRTTRASVASDGSQGNRDSGGEFTGAVTLSGDGGVVAFKSFATNLVPGDTNWWQDIFVRVLSSAPCDARADCGNLPGPPSNLTAQVTGATVAFNWHQPASGGPVETYVLGAGLSPAANDVQLATGSTATSFTVNAPAGTYFVWVSGRNSTGTGPPSNQVVVNVNVGGGGCAVAPDPPAGLRATVGGRTARGHVVVLDWSASTGCPAQSYLLEAGTMAGAAEFVSEVANVTTLTAVDVPPGTYYVRLRGRNPFGISGPSNEVIVIVP